MGKPIHIQQFFELRGQDAHELADRLSDMRKQVDERGGVVLDVEWSEQSATVLCEVPAAQEAVRG